MRNSNQLSAAFVRTVTGHGVYSDGNGLTLRVDKSGKRWVQRVTINGKRHNIGLGSYRLVSLAEARDNALANAQTIRHGRDPVLEKRQALEESRRLDKPTFAVAAETVIELRRPTWRNAKHSAQWSSTLTTYAFPIIGSKLVDEVDTADVLSVLTRIWVDKPETASRVRQRMETVFDWVIAQGWRQDNPAAQPITKALPKVKRKKKHFKALPYADVPRAGKKVRECSADTSTKLCLEFLILTAARSGEARSAQWQEIDWQELWWTIPPERMKADREHSVPLSRRSVEVLQAAWTISGGGDLIFPASRRNKSLSDMTLLRLLQRQDIPCVVHGYRSSFLTWALELSGEEREVRKTALAHDPDDDDTEMAYIRSYLFDRRRPFMESWAEFICAGVARIE
jgi:integrase